MGGEISGSANRPCVRQSGAEMSGEEKRGDVPEEREERTRFEEEKVETEYGEDHHCREEDDCEWPHAPQKQTRKQNKETRTRFI